MDSCGVIPEFRVSEISGTQGGKRTLFGVESFARGETRDGKPMFAIDVRCLDGVDVSKLSPKPFDGLSR